MNYPTYMFKRGPYGEPLPEMVQRMIWRLADLQSAQIGAQSLLSRVLSGQFDSPDDLDLEKCSFCDGAECDGGCGTHDPADPS